MGRLAVLLLVVVSAGAAHGAEVICNATLNVKCYGTPGEPVYLQMTRATREYGLHLKRNNIMIFKFAENNSKLYNTSLAKRLMFFSANGTLSINPVELTDMGIYEIEIYGADGIHLSSHSLTLIVNEMTPVTQTISDTTHTTLYDSSQLKPENKWHMKQFGVILIIIGVLGSLLWLTALGGLFYRYKNRSSTCRAAEHVELDYAEVSALRRPRRQEEQKERREDTVEYGEVKVQIAHTPVLQEECVSITVYSVLKTRHNKESLEVYCV